MPLMAIWLVAAAGAGLDHAEPSAPAQSGLTVFMRAVSTRVCNSKHGTAGASLKKCTSFSSTKVLKMLVHIANNKKQSVLAVSANLAKAQFGSMKVVMTTHQGWLHEQCNIIYNSPLEV